MTRLLARPGARCPAVAALVVAALTLAGCSSGSAGAAPSPTASATPAATASASAQPSSADATQRKVLLIVEENKTFAETIGTQAAPYLNGLAKTYGLATAMNAGYPPGCPSLAAYILMTSGSTHDICDDRNPSAHLLGGDNLFNQVAAAGREWRSYAEGMPSPCLRTNSDDGRYLVRHVPSTYYLTESSRCEQWTVPLGSLTSGALHDDLAAGRLPAYAMITPDACNDMHGASGCGQDQVRQGDAWLASWMPAILASPDYRAGRLTVLVTWDEGTLVNNHIPTLVISPSTHAISSGTAWTHCSLLRTTEEILGLPLLGCAGPAASMREAFQL